MNVRKTFKKLFVPHKGNKYKPHLLRGPVVIVIVIIVFSLFSIYIYGPHIAIDHKTTAAIYSSILVDLANHESALAISPVLTEAAQLKADDMAQKSYFAHTSPEGLTPWHWFDEVHYSYLYAGENLAVDFTDSDQVVEAWMNSPTHRANLLSDNFTQIGIAFANGTWQGRSTIFVVQDFGMPDPTVAAPVSKPVAIKTGAVATKASGTAAAAVQKPIAAAPEVKGEETQKRHTVVIAETPTFIAVASQKSSSTAAALQNFAATQAALKANAALVPQVANQPATFGSRIKDIFIRSTMLQPVVFLGFAYLIISLVVGFALAMAIFIERKNQHIRHILYGCSVIAVIVILFSIAASHGSSFVYVM